MTIWSSLYLPSLAGKLMRAGCLLRFVVLTAWGQRKLWKALRCGDGNCTKNSIGQKNRFSWEFAISAPDLRYGMKLGENVLRNKKQWLIFQDSTTREMLGQCRLWVIGALAGTLGVFGIVSSVLIQIKAEIIFTATSLRVLVAPGIVKVWTMGNVSAYYWNTTKTFHLLYMVLVTFSSWAPPSSLGGFSLVLDDPYFFTACHHLFSLLWFSWNQVKNKGCMPEGLKNWTDPWRSHFWICFFFRETLGNLLYFLILQKQDPEKLFMVQYWSAGITHSKEARVFKEASREIILQRNDKWMKVQFIFQGFHVFPK